MIPFGVSSWFGPLHFIFEYRSIPEGKFEFSYWNRLYEIERVSFLRNNSNQVVLRTKESQLGKFGDQNGYFSSASFDVGAFFERQTWLTIIWLALCGQMMIKNLFWIKKSNFFNLTQANKINFSYSKRFSFLSTEKCS